MNERRAIEVSGNESHLMIGRPNNRGCLCHDTLEFFRLAKQRGQQTGNHESVYGGIGALVVLL